ncbi:C39 family peptidase, partial [Methylicorpusculum sp.]|uniref:C39 family peptidase n=1 Tax=Methylicorpusculum sp. TaxID=2713644 RepID=UPI002ABB02A4
MNRVQSTCRILIWGTVLGHCLNLFAMSDDDRWVRIYRKRFTPQESQVMAGQKTILWPREATDVTPFSHLMFSWNAIRPATGYFTFSAQVRDTVTKEWGPWHMMMDWGDRQRSYLQKTPLLSSYYHVRLELNNDRLADAFRIRVDTHDGASLALLKTIIVCASDFSRFRPDIVNQELLSLPSVHVLGVPQLSQFMVDHARKEALCSPTSVSMLAGFVNGQKIAVTTVAEQVFDAGLNAYGSWPFNTAHLYELLSGTGCVAACRLNSFAQLHTSLQRKMPVIVSVRGWLGGAPKAYESGHLLVVVGWDAHKRQVICHDPAAKKNGQVVRQYAIRDFLAAWERSRRLAYLLEMAN